MVAAWYGKGSTRPRTTDKKGTRQFSVVGTTRKVAAAKRHGERKLAEQGFIKESSGYQRREQALQAPLGSFAAARDRKEARHLPSSPEMQEDTLYRNGNFKKGEHSTREHLHTAALFTEHKEREMFVPRNALVTMKTPLPPTIATNHPSAGVTWIVQPKALTHQDHTEPP